MNPSLEAVLRRDRAVVFAALAVITALAWADIIWLADDMAMDGMDMTGFRMIPAGQGLMMPASAPWQPLEFVYVFAMWAVMMTSFAFIFGLFPLVIATGAGAATRHAVGTPVFGGMIAAAIFGVFVIPLLFVIAEQLCYLTRK